MAADDPIFPKAGGTQTGHPRIALIALTGPAKELATRLAAGLEGAMVLAPGSKVAETIARHWREFDGFICIMATGIVVRAIAPLLADKRHDPAVVVVDELGRHAISLLSGHLGGANELARQVAELCGGSAVITTASDLQGHTALDLWAREHGLVAADPAALTAASARLLAQGFLTVFSEVGGDSWPNDLRPVANSAAADLIIRGWGGDVVDLLTNSCNAHKEGTFGSLVPKLVNKSTTSPIVLHPRNLVVGIGCHRGTTEAAIREAIAASLARAGLAVAAVRNLASHEIKNQEPGLLAFAEAEGLAIVFYPSEALNQVPDTARSAAAHRATGAWSVSEAAARLSAGSDNLLIRKEKWPNLTIAVAEARFSWSAWDRAAAPI